MTVTSAIESAHTPSVLDSGRTTRPTGDRTRLPPGPHHSEPTSTAPVTPSVEETSSATA